MRRFVIAALVGATLGACNVSGRPMPDSDASPRSASTPTAVASPPAIPNAIPTEAFATLSDEPMPEDVAGALQEVLDASADGHGLTATVITSAGTWSGASGSTATGERAMVPNDQMAIASITKTIVSAQVLLLVEDGSLSLDDLAADRLPPDLTFDTSSVTIENLLSMRSGIPAYFPDEEGLIAATLSDPMRFWTADEKLATVGSERGPVGEDWEYIGTNYLLLGLIIEQVTGRSLAEVLRSGVLAGDGYDRLIYQPDERPTEPMAMAIEPVATVESFSNGGGYLPSLAVATMFSSEGGMASDAPTLARWFAHLCAGRVVSSSLLAEMTDFVERPGYGLGVIDRSAEYWPGSGAFGHTGGNTIAVALCFQDPVGVVVVLANSEHDVDTVAGSLVRTAAGDG